MEPEPSPLWRISVSTEIGGGIRIPDGGKVSTAKLGDGTTYERITIPFPEYGPAFETVDSGITALVYGYGGFYFMWRKSAVCVVISHGRDLPISQVTVPDGTRWEPDSMVAFARTWVHQRLEWAVRQSRAYYDHRHAPDDPDGREVTE
jgi:hypothetical protein